MKKIAVIDYGMSNLRSVSKAIEHVAGQQWQVVITRQPEEILSADKIVFPGQGAIGQCMVLLNETGLTSVLQEVIKTKPFLGICLGLQSLFAHSEENGGTAGLGIVAGNVQRFVEPLLEPTTGEKLKIPQMGWNQVLSTQVAHPIWKNIPDNSRFYFVHSYYVVPEDNNITAATTTYGTTIFTSAIAHENLVAVQFHPEKSQKAGLTLLSNFVDW